MQYTALDMLVSGEQQTVWILVAIVCVLLLCIAQLLIHLRRVVRRHRRYLRPMEEAMWDQTLLVKGLTKRIDAIKETEDTVVYRLCTGLKSPLKRLQWNIDNLFLSTRMALPPADVRALREIQEAGHSITHSVTKLVTLLDIQEGRGKIRLETVDPAALVRAVYAASRQTMDHLGLAFDLSLPKRAIKDVPMDRGRIRECLEFFLENARSYTPQGGNVTIALAETKTGIRISVTDTGMGIPMNEQNKVWEKFFRSPSAAEQKPDGTGAGLAIVKYYVKAHGGHVGFTSRHGKGSMFWMELPSVPFMANP